MADLARQWLQIRRHVLAVRRIWNRITPMEQLRCEFCSNLWNTASHAIRARIERLSEQCFRISNGKRFTLVRFHYIDIDTYFSLMLVESKSLIDCMLGESGEINETNLPSGLHHDELTANEAERASVPEQILEYTLCKRQFEPSLASSRVTPGPRTVEESQELCSA